jgi:CHAT domain-containing protein
VYDLERLQRAPQTIMLAACDTARTLSHPGDEMTGLASGLLAAGASSVIAPLLPLPDDVAAQISRGWHARLNAGQAPAQALSATAAAIAQDGPLARLAATSLVCLGHG